MFKVEKSLSPKNLAAAVYNESSMQMLTTEKNIATRTDKSIGLLNLALNPDLFR